MKCIAVIPARAGSKRLPGKNKTLFRGIPLVEHTLIAAVESDVFEKIVVSSDDDEILALGRKHGLVSEARRPELAGDRARVSDVCVDVLTRHTGFDLLCCLYATAPLRTADDIRRSLDRMNSTGAAAVICATRYLHPPQQALRPSDGGGWELAFPDWGRKQSQDVPPLRVDNGACYWVRVKEFLRGQTFYLSPLQLHEMPVERSLDLDTPEDLLLLKRLYPDA